MRPFLFDLILKDGRDLTCWKVKEKEPVERQILKISTREKGDDKEALEGDKIESSWRGEP